MPEGELHMVQRQFDRTTSVTAHSFETKTASTNKFGRKEYKSSVKITMILDMTTMMQLFCRYEVGIPCLQVVQQDRLCTLACDHGLKLQHSSRQAIVDSNIALLRHMKVRLKTAAAVSCMKLQHVLDVRTLATRNLRL